MTHVFHLCVCGGGGGGGGGGGVSSYPSDPLLTRYVISHTLTGGLTVLVWNSLLLVQLFCGL